MLLGDGEAVGRAGDGAHGDGVDGATRPGEAGGDEARRDGAAQVGVRECLATAERRGRQRAPGAEVVAPIQKGIGEWGGSEGRGESGREKWEGNKSGKSKVTRRKKRKEKDSETEEDTDSDTEEEEDSKKATKKKSGKSNSTRRKKQKEETESDTEEETEADTEEETEADTEEEEDSGTQEEEDSDAEEEGDSDAEEEGDSDAEEEEDSYAEDGGLRRARKRPLEVAEEDCAKPNKWASAQLKRKGAPNVNAGRKKKNDDKGARGKPVKKDSRKGGKEQAKGVMKTKRPDRNVPQAERIRAVKLASIAMTRKSVKKAIVK
nr:tripartite motif-containing protein 44-like [Aegilops tauschii subsp. strangulata]